MKGGKYIAFEIDQETYAVPVGTVREIVRVPELTRVPLAPPYVEGVANLRGEILPVVSLRKRLGLEEKPLDELSRVVVFEKGGDIVGAIVDRMAEAIVLEEGNIERREGIGAESDFLEGVAKAGDGKKLYLLFNVNRLFEWENQEKQDRKGKMLSFETEEAVGRREAIAENQLVSFKLGSGVYAIDIRDIQEVIRYTQPTEIPNVPFYVRGIIQLRDGILPVVDLRLKMGMEASAIDEFTKVVVVETPQARVGFVVDCIHKVLRVAESEIKSPPELLEQQLGGELKGIVEVDGEMVLLLNSQKLVSEEVTLLGEKAGRSEREGEVVETRGKENQYVVFALGDELFGVPIEQIQEINRLPEVTRVPHTASFIEGVVNLRGEVIPVIDLRKRFGLPPRGYDEFTRIVVADIGGQKTGFIVDAVKEVGKYPEKDIASSPGILGSKASRFVKGLVKLSEQKMILLLDLSAVLAEEEKEELEKVRKNSEAKGGSKEGSQKKLRRAE
uniref:CheW-like domain-containing protein n=1 Tax=Candidatus Caldatribacterium saccharofermentans TaxID=1454753 RepID=A0A7V4TZG7_9BACT